MYKAQWAFGKTLRKKGLKGWFFSQLVGRRTYYVIDNRGHYYWLSSIPSEKKYENKNMSLLFHTFLKK